MVTVRTLTLLLGLILFLLGTVLVVLALERGGGPLLGTAVAALVGSAASLATAALLGRRRRTPLETRREQRLWRSGPLGRRWLKSRRRSP